MVFLGEAKIQQFPLSYYGIGPNSPKDHPALVNSFNVLFRQRVLRKLRKNFFLGPEIDYQLVSGVQFEQPEEGNPHYIPLGADGTSNLGLGLALVYDDRHNMLNVREGRFGEIAYLRYIDDFVSEYIVINTLSRSKWSIASFPLHSAKDLVRPFSRPRESLLPNLMPLKPTM